MLKHDQQTDDNPVLIAYRAVRDTGSLVSYDLMADYQRFFSTSPLVSCSNGVPFERFSLVDPSLRTVIQSSTTPI